MFGKVKTPALEQLENNFKKQGGEWKAKKLIDLFDFKRGTRLCKKDRVDGKYPLVTAGENNLGVKCFIGNQTQEIFSNAITIDMFCNSFVHIDEFCCDDNILVLTAKTKMSRNCMLYISSIINRCKTNWGYEKQYRIESLKTHSVSMPFVFDSIAFDYMEKYVHEIEGQNMDQFAQYLQELQMEECRLTHQEQKLLDLAKPKETKSFKIGKLFRIRPTRSYKMTNIDLFKTSGNIPVVTNSSLSNGVSGYVGLQPTEKGNMITYSDTTTSDGIFYQPKDFVGYSHVQGLYPIDYQANWNRFTLLYFVTAFKKTAFGKFDYGNKFTRNLAQELEVCLPIDSKGKIDFEYMENLVKTLQKQSLDKVMTYFEGGI